MLIGVTAALNLALFLSHYNNAEESDRESFGAVDLPSEDTQQDHHLSDNLFDLFTASVAPTLKTKRHARMRIASDRGGVGNGRSHETVVISVYYPQIS